MSRLLILVCAALSAVGGRAAADDVDPEPRSKSNVVAIVTNHGTIVVELYPNKAPVTVKNFLGYVDKKFYDDLVFHRVIDAFMIQGGGYPKGLAKAATPEKTEKAAGAAIKCESDNGLSNERGTIAMARTNDPNSATSQFFINTVDNAILDWAKARDRVGYCVFGKVIKGMDVVDKIRKVKTVSAGGLNDVPAEDVVIKSVRRTRR